MPWINDRPTGDNRLTDAGPRNKPLGAGDTMGGGGGEDAAAPRPDPKGFGGLADSLGITNNYSAGTAKADYGGKEYGYGNSGYEQAGWKADDVANGKMSFGPGAYVGDSRIDRDYGLAAKQAGQVDYDYMQAQNLAANVRQQGLDAAAQQQMGLAKSGNPMQGGMAAYGAQQQGAQMGQQAVQQGIQQSAQMKQQYDQMRLQQDLQNRQMNLGLLGQSQQNAQFGAQYGMQGAEMNQDLYKSLMGLQQGYGQQALQGQMGYAAQASGNYNHAQDINAGVAGQQGEAGGQTMAAAMAAAAAMFSDERLKTNMGSGSAATSDFLGSLAPTSYRYKDGVPGENPNADRFGILAQDVGRTPMGRSLIEETPIGKAINVPHATGALLAGEGELYARQQRLEAELRALKGGR